MEAFVFVKAAPGKHKEVISGLAEADSSKKNFKISGIKKVYRTSGEYDAVAVVSANDLAGINKVVDEIKILTSKGLGQIVAETNLMMLVPKTLGDP